MTLNNGKNIIMYRLGQLFVTIFFVVLFSILFATDLVKAPLAGLDKKDIALLLLAAYILFMMYHYFIDLNYIYFSDDGPNIILRYYSVKIFSKRHHSIEIPKNQFTGYKIQHRLLRLKPMITLYLKVSKGAGKFPPVSLASLNRDQLRDVMESLDQYVKTA